jgi:type IV pilus assembly protein PilO
MKLGIRELVFFALMVGLLCAAYFILDKKSKKREEKLASVQTMQQSLTNLRLSMSGIDDQDRKISELHQAIAFFESKLPQEKEMDVILADVSRKVEENGLTLRTVKTLKTERGPNYSELPIQMNISGDFNGFYELMLQLEKMDRITRVSQMKLEKIDERDGEMQAQLTLSIFFEPDTSNIATAVVQ